MSHVARAAGAACEFQVASSVVQKDCPSRSASSSTAATDDKTVRLQSAFVNGVRMLESLNGRVPDLKCKVKHTFLEVESCDNEEEVSEAGDMPKWSRARAVSDSAIQYGGDSDHGCSSTAASTPRSQQSGCLGGLASCHDETACGALACQDSPVAAAMPQINGFNVVSCVEPCQENSSVLGHGGVGFVFLPVTIMPYPQWVHGAASTDNWARMPPVKAMSAASVALTPKPSMCGITTTPMSGQACDEDDRTTLMLRNLPNDCTRDILLDMLNSEGFRGAYDFVYFPMDFNNDVSFSYAFVNMVSRDEAIRLHCRFQGFSGWHSSLAPSPRICDVVWSGDHQGYAAHIERYRNSPVMHALVPDKYKPIVLSRGVRVEFPAPTKRIRKPRMRHSV